MRRILIVGAHSVLRRAQQNPEVSLAHSTAAKRSRPSIGKPVLGHREERARAFGWDRSADHIRASSQTAAFKGRIHGCTRTLRKTSDSSCTAGAVHTWPITGTTTDDPDGRLPVLPPSPACSPARGYFRSQGAAVRPRARPYSRAKYTSALRAMDARCPPDRDRRVEPGDDIAGCVDLIPRPLTRSPARAGAIAAPNPASAGIRPSPYG